MNDKWKAKLISQGKVWINQALADSYQKQEQEEYLGDDFKEYIENLEMYLIDEGRSEDEVERLIDEEIKIAIENEKAECRRGKWPGESKESWDRRWWEALNQDHLY